MFRQLVSASLCASCLAITPVLASDATDLSREARRTDQIAANGQQQVVDRLATTFTGTFGTTEETRAMVTSLRDGTRQGKRSGTMGYGEIHIALALAQEYSAERGVTADVALDRILAQRIEGKGWGRIAQDAGFKLGPVVSRLRSDNARLERPVPHRVTQAERAVRPERMEKPDRPERLERPMRPERFERHGKS